MCGILGVALRTPPAARVSLSSLSDSLAHRGPDDAGEWWSEDGRVGLAHRRLSIIELGPAGHQPMHSEGERAVIVFNGEIYNFHDLRRELAARGRTFRTQGDSEVILAAYLEWGDDCVRRFNGAFALALYDRVRRRLFLARDRAGEKPLFYCLRAGSMRFASELKALMADPAFERRVDVEALDYFLAYGHVPGGRCILEGVNKLPPAHALSFEPTTEECHVWRYWSPPPPPKGPLPRQVDLLAELEPLLEDAVRRQLIADVPVGIMLSGGVDSSLITAMAARVRPRVKTFTVRFQGSREHDESAHARLIADHFATDHAELDVGESTADLLGALAEQFDEPIVDSSMIPTFLVTREIRRHCAVALGGDGGDELFGGYVHYNRLLWMDRYFRAFPMRWRSVLAGSAGRMMPLGAKGRNWLQALDVDLSTGLPAIASFFGPQEREKMLQAHRRPRVLAEYQRASRIPREDDLLQRASRMDFENYLAEDILVKVDRASMMNSLEVRAPFLDYRLVEFAFGRVPSALKATPWDRKILLKALCERLLPPSFDRRRKQGFSIPLAKWLRQGPWRDRFREILLGTGGGAFSPQFVAELFAGQDKGRSNSERLFALALFETWRRRYAVSMG